MSGRREKKKVDIKRRNPIFKNVSLFLGISFISLWHYCTYAIGGKLTSGIFIGVYPILAYCTS